eukprot:Opistho-1_new@55911
MARRVLLAVAIACLVACAAARPATTCITTGIRVDCGYVGIQQAECEGKGCCWSPTQDGSPWCFNQNGPRASYVVSKSQTTNTGLSMTLTLNGASPAYYSADISPVAVDVYFETQSRLHVRIYDPAMQRFEVPDAFSPRPPLPTSKPASTDYAFSSAAEGEVFWFAVVRRSNGETLFNTSSATGAFGGLVFEDQYLELSTSMPDNANLYGLGERVRSLRLDDALTYTLWTYDTPTPPNDNLYGAHPFYMQHSTSGQSHGVFLRNSNGMDISVRPGALTYRVIGGILDFYFMLGPTPTDVIRQYSDVIGRPHVPPYWGLGFHQCRYGYPNVDTLIQVVANYSANKIPLDTMWTDIDYMDAYKDFTFDPTNFPVSRMSPFVQQLHSNGQQYVVIVDPGIKNEAGYPAYDDGLKQDVFIRDKAGNPFVGKVWPGLTVFPDFFAPNANGWWADQVQSFLNMVPVDGLWIDMNEISNFCDGECSTKDLAPNGKSLVHSVSRPHVERVLANVSYYATAFDPNNPPYKINNQNSHAPLSSKTLSMDSVHHGGLLEYDVHNLFGLTEAIATRAALEKIRSSRAFVISRSTFPGSGAHTGHWTGDNHASWDDLYYSIPGMLAFQMYGVPLVGSDICGFLDDTTEELCGRWMQLGAFYPFSRNHNNRGQRPQEPYVWASVAAISRNALATRYSLLPYYYSLFRLANADGSPVMRALFFEFPTDANTFAIDRQFLIGDAVLVSPVLTQGATTVSAYFPAGVWYDFYTHAVAVSSSQGSTLQLAAPLEKINLHVRGGKIIPMQGAALTTRDARKTPFLLTVAPDASGAASGFLYLDDGSSLDLSQYVRMDYTAAVKGSTGTLTGVVSYANFAGASSFSLGSIVVFGVAAAPSTVTVNKAMLPASSVQYDAASKSLTLSSLGLPVSAALAVSWN